MAEISYFWDGVATGDAVNAPYSSKEFCDLWDILFSSDNTAQGPVGGYLNELAVSGASSPVSIATGAALVSGHPYLNDAASTLVIPSPAAATRIDLVVLHLDANAQTIRIARVAGIEGGGAPSPTQAWPIWEVPIAQVSITTGGVCTVTDKRSFVRARIAPGYKYSELAANDNTHSSTWNSLGAGVKFTLTPGVWLLSGIIYTQLAGNGTAGIQINNNTTGSALAAGNATGSTGEFLIMPIGPHIVTITAENVIELRYHHANVADTVNGAASGAPTALTAIRVA